MSETKQRILVVGGGFGGVKAALELCDDPRFSVTLLSSESELRYYPTLYHTAVGGSRANSSIPLSVIFNGKDITIIKDTAVTVDKKAKSITCESGTVFPYDTLVLALGVVTNYFGIPGLDQYSFSIKSQSEVARLKAHLHDQLSAEHKPDLNYVIVGAGPTGIELAGALPSYLEKLMNDHGLARRKVHIDLIEAAPKLLPRLPSDASRTIARHLKRLGIKIFVNSVVQGETPDSLMVNGKPIQSHTVIWTAGVTNHPFFAANNFSIMNRGKVAVDVYLKADDGIYVIGDNANTPYSGLAQTALLDGIFVANNLKRQASGHDMVAYRPHKPITVIPAGPKWAAVIMGKLRLYGTLGWLIRESADLRGFKDLEPLTEATRQWLTEFSSQEDCPVCALATVTT